MIHVAIRGFKKSYSGLSKSIWLLSFVMLINRCGTMVLPFLTSYCTREKGFSTTQAGLVVGCYGLGAMCGALLGGRISDRLGFYRLQVMSLMLGGVFFIVLQYLRSYAAICAGAFILSMVNESFRPANAAAISYYSTEDTRTRSFSLIRLAINIGWGVGAGLAGLLASMNYAYLFWTDGITNISAAILLLLLLPRVHLSQQQHTPGNVLEKKAAVTTSQSAYKDKTFLRFILLQTCFAICFFQLFTTLPLYYYQGWHLNEKWYGIVMSVNGILIALIEMPIVFRLEGRKTPLTFIAAGTFLTGIFFFMLNITGIPVLIVAFASMVTVTIAEIIAMPFMNSYYIGRSSNENRGQYAGLFTMVWSLAQVLASTGGTQVAYRIGFSNLWWLLGGLCMFTACGYYRLRRH